MPDIALITCLNLPEPDLDQDLLLAALRHRGVSADLLAWDDPAADPGAYDLCVLRSCWNYYLSPDAFLDWVEHAARHSRLVNSVEVVRWNLHKSYLCDLATAGTPVVPTVLCPQGETVDLSTLLKEQNWDHVVIKPAISAASYATQDFTTGHLQQGQAFLDSLLRERDVIVQRYLPSVVSPGERSLVWIDGQFTHMVVKQPRFKDRAESVSGALPISLQDRLAAERVIAYIQDDLLYARVDFLQDPGGGVPLVSEFELIEPSLFLLQSPAALHRFVDAISRQLLSG